MGGAAGMAGFGSMLFNSGSIAMGGGAATTAAGIGGIKGTLAGIGTSNAALIAGPMLMLAGAQQQNKWLRMGMMGGGGALTGLVLGAKIGAIGGPMGAAIGAATGTTAGTAGAHAATAGTAGSTRTACCVAMRPRRPTTSTVRGDGAMEARNPLSPSGLCFISSAVAMSAWWRPLMFGVGRPATAACTTMRMCRTVNSARKNAALAWKGDAAVIPARTLPAPAIISWKIST